MPIEQFELPDVGEGIANGELVSWLVTAGETVEEDQPVAEIETDKALVDVPSPFDGIVHELVAEEGEIVPVGDVFIAFDISANPDEDGLEAESSPGNRTDVQTNGTTEPETSVEAATDGTADGADVSASMNSHSTGPETGPKTRTGAEMKNGTRTEANTSEPVGETSTSGGRVFAPPSVRRLARETGVDISSVEGSGPGGRVTEADVRAQTESGSHAESRTTPKRTGPPDSQGRTATGDQPSGLTTAGESKSVSTPPAPQNGTTRKRTLAAPATRRVAREEDIDIGAVPTDESRDGEAFVTRHHVREYADTAGKTSGTDESQVESKPPGQTEQTADPAAQHGTGPTDETSMTATTEASGGSAVGETRPYRGIRRSIGDRMSESRFTAPHVTHHDTVEVPALVETRERLREDATRQDIRLTLMPFILKAVVAGLQEYPILNSELRESDEEILLKQEYNIGVAVATEAGLMVPVVNNVGRKGLLELATEVNDLAARARDRSLTPAELNGSTFTVTNFGAIGGEYATPIINYPETAILGLGGLEKRPVVDDGDVVARETLPLSLSIDHRVIDGGDAANFVNTVMSYLEDPSRLLL